MGLNCQQKKIDLLWDCLTSTLYLVLMRLLTWTGGRMLSSNGKELYCAAYLVRRLGRWFWFGLQIFAFNYLFFLLTAFIAYEVGSGEPINADFWTLKPATLSMCSLHCKDYNGQSGARYCHTFKKVCLSAGQIRSISRLSLVLRICQTGIITNQIWIWIVLKWGVGEFSLCFVANLVNNLFYVFCWP